MATDMTVAKTILSQLGGARFINKCSNSLIDWDLEHRIRDARKLAHEMASKKGR